MCRALDSALSDITPFSGAPKWSSEEISESKVHVPFNTSLRHSISHSIISGTPSPTCKKVRCGGNKGTSDVAIRSFFSSRLAAASVAVLASSAPLRGAVTLLPPPPVLLPAPPPAPPPSLTLPGHTLLPRSHGLHVSPGKPGKLWSLASVRGLSRAAPSIACGAPTLVPLAIMRRSPRAREFGVCYAET